ncbi:sugar phosphate isomerase/epimerase [Verrucomicrobia bacterium]|nr:sugar phosphate isomerase/epimerase [Verrucomicrobiota bacterium]
MKHMQRRQFIKSGAAAMALVGSSQFLQAAKGFDFNWIISSCMYGTLPLSSILPEIKRAGVNEIDIWPLSHGDQREQMEKMGMDAFEALLTQHQVKLGCFTHYDLGPFGLDKEMKIAKRFGCPVMVCGGKGPRNLKGSELKAAVRKFVEQLKPHVAVAEENGVRIAIENHGNNLIDSADSLKWLMELEPSENLAVALAPYHLEVLGLGPKELAELIHDLGNRMAVFYAWQHGMGCSKKLPKEQELLQMPGRGDLDFAPIVKALQEIKYNGRTQVFMHPVPRGIPILDTAKDVTNEIIRAQNHLKAYV